MRISEEVTESLYNSITKIDSLINTENDLELMRTQLKTTIESLKFVYFNLCMR